MPQSDKDRMVRSVLAKALADIKTDPCTDCGGTFHPYVMDFDHRVPAEKSYSVGQLVNHLNYEKFLAEIVKCDLVCSNCHRLRTWKKMQENRVEHFKPRT